MNLLFAFIIYISTTCTATEMLYVLPDNVSDVNCPSQPCTTLGQYLLDNGSLPVLSDVEYHFLPGEYHVNNHINIREGYNFSLIGFDLSPVKLVCRSHHYVSVLFSYNVTITNLVFSQCSGDFGTQFGIHVTAGLFLYECSHCSVENVYFEGYGFVGYNLLQNSYLNNVTIDITIVKRSVNTCSSKFVLKFINAKGSYNFLYVNQVFISGYGELCLTESHQLMQVYTDKSYGLHIEFHNLQFYNITQAALDIDMKYTDTSMSFKNCTFAYSMNAIDSIHKTIYGKIPSNNASLKFENCAFHYNVAYLLLFLRLDDHDDFCIHPSNITIENCNFTGNNGGNMMFLYGMSNCKPNIFFNEVINLVNNKIEYFIIRIQYMIVKLNGTVIVKENNARYVIITFINCEIAFTKMIIFLSNICRTILDIVSVDMKYILMMENANITLINNTYYDLMASEPITNTYVDVFPHCIFQYIALANDKQNVSFNISLSGNKQLKKTSIHNSRSATTVTNVHDLLTHCEWLPEALFNGYDPGYINHQIIQVDGQQWIHQKQICYCPHDGPYDCTVDLLGPVYPGQRLQIELCIPHAISGKDYVLHVQTNSASLPNTACKIAHQTEFINNIRNYSKTFNFTVIFEGELCELFLTIEPFVRNAFYVQLLPCPVGFTLQNGRCDCDPFLPPDIDTCYIDLSAIRRPANTWITVHTLTNNITNYLLSDCPMDYCLPYSTNVNLLHPDLQCQFNRTGILCSQCPHPLSMVFASSRCMKCTNVHILITIIVIVAGIVLVVLLYVLNLTVTNGTINGIIFYANIVSINDSVFLVNDNVFKPLRVFISFSNLDLGIETCFYNGMDSYVKMWLQLFFPSYLIIIAVSIIIASRYSSRVLRLTYRRSLPVLATLFLLSYTGVLRVVLTVLFSYSTITHYPSGDTQTAWSIDASVPLFGLKFTILFITCLLLLILITFSIALLFTRYLSRFRIFNYFKPLIDLIDAFQGSYKSKYYYWITIHMMFRNMFFFFHAFQILNLILATISLVIFTSCYGYLKPNKNKMINFQELLILVNLTIMYAVSIQENKRIFSVITNVMMSLALIQFSIIVVGHFFIYTCHYKFSIIGKLKILFNKRNSSQFI